MENFDQVTC